MCNTSYNEKNFMQDWNEVMTLSNENQKKLNEDVLSSLNFNPYDGFLRLCLPRSTLTELNDNNKFIEEDRCPKGFICRWAPQNDINYIEICCPLFNNVI